MVYAFETATAYIVGSYWHGLANNGMTPSERATLSPSDPEHGLRINGSKTQLVGWSLYTLLLWLLKLCLNIFYSRLTKEMHEMHVRIRIAFAAIAVTYLATILSILFGCTPFRKNWQIDPDPGNRCQPAISKINLYVTVVLNVLTDAYLLSIPLPMLWRAAIPRARKAGLLVVFGGGIFVIMAGILRCVLILTDPVNGARQAGSWAVRETFVAVVIGNVPMIYPLLRRLVGDARTQLSAVRSGSGMKGSWSGSRSTERSRGRCEAGRRMHPLQNMAFGESKDPIVPAGGEERSAGKHVSLTAFAELDGEIRSDRFSV